MIVDSFTCRLLLLLALCTSPALAHEAWILPWGFHQDETSLVRAHIQVGQLFDGSSQLYNPDKFDRLEVVHDGKAEPVRGRVGDLPAISHSLDKPGLQTLVYQSSGDVISYGNWDKFRDFTTKEGVSWAQDEHRRRGHPESGFDEVFIRCAKSLITWKDSEGDDSRVGMPAEIVALNNPYIDGKTLDVQVWWQDKPYADAQVAVFAKPDDAAATRVNMMSDAEGRLSVPIKPGIRYLLNSVVMEPLDDGRNTPLWRSYWASMTLKLP